MTAESILGTFESLTADSPHHVMEVTDLHTSPAVFTPVPRSCDVVTPIVTCIQCQCATCRAMNMLCTESHQIEVTHTTWPSCMHKWNKASSTVGSAHQPDRAVHVHPQQVALVRIHGCINWEALRDGPRCCHSAKNSLLLCAFPFSQSFHNSLSGAPASQLPHIRFKQYTGDEREPQQHSPRYIIQACATRLATESARHPILQGFPADLQQRGRLSEQAQSAAVALYLFKGSQQKWTYKIGSQATVVFATLPPPPVLPAKLGGFAHHSFAGQAKPPMQLMRFRQN
jgi:hypothetical protein